MSNEFVLPPLPPDEKEKPFVLPALPPTGVATPQANVPPPQNQGTDWKDIGVGLAGAPAVATARGAGTPKEIHDFRLNFPFNVNPKLAPQYRAYEALISEPNATYENTETGEIYDPAFQKALKASVREKPPLDYLWSKYIDPLLFGEQKGELGSIRTEGGILPTTEGAYAALPDYVKTNPKTAEGKKAQNYAADAILGAATLPLGGEGTALGWMKSLPRWAMGNVGRTGIIMGGEYGGEELADYLLSDPKRNAGAPYAPFAQPAMTLASQILAHKFIPSKALPARAEDEAAQLIRADRQNLISKLSSTDLDYIGTASGMTHDQVKSAIMAGVPLQGVNIGGTNTRAALGEASGLSEEAAGLISAYNEGLKATAGDIPLTKFNSKERVKRYFQNQVGEENFDDIIKQHMASNKAETNRLYDTAMIHPQAQSVNIPNNLKNNPAIREAQRQVEADLETSKKFYGYESREVIPPKDAGEPFEYFDGQRMVRTQSPPSNGNLAYWDMVKRRLYEMSQTRDISFNDKAGADVARRNLTDHLDASVPGYEDARSSSIEGFGDLSAGNIGRQIGARAGTKALDKVDEEIGVSHRAILKGEIQNMSDEQRQIAKQGVYQSLYDRMKNPEDLQRISKGLLDGTLGDDLKLVLGESEYSKLKGKVIGEAIVGNAPTIALKEPRSRIKEAFGSSFAGFGTAAGLAATVAASVSEMFLNNAFLPEALHGFGILSGVVGTAVAGAKYLDARQAQKMAVELTKKLLTDGGKTAERLSKLAEKDPAVHMMLSKLITPSRFALTQKQDILRKYSGPASQPNEQEGQFAGGRIGRASGGRAAGRSAKSKAAQLVALVEKQRKEQGKEMSPLLNLDDATVVKALAVANKTI